MWLCRRIALKSWDAGSIGVEGSVCGCEGVWRVDRARENEGGWVGTSGQGFVVRL